MQHVVLLGGTWSGADVSAHSPNRSSREWWVPDGQCGGVDAVVAGEAAQLLHLLLDQCRQAQPCPLRVRVGGHGREAA
ncbi:hypothetical protein AMK31_35545 [Streptomyces sp. TSRI0107]|nr:hypothetical protein AMK31_35545 [Streptomyces sp. TSRI0107]